MESIILASRPGPLGGQYLSTRLRRALPRALFFFAIAANRVGRRHDDLLARSHHIKAREASSVREATSENK